MSNGLLIGVMILQIAVLLSIWLRKTSSRLGSEGRAQLDNLLSRLQQVESHLRDEMARNREEMSQAARLSRQESADSLARMSEGLNKAIQEGAHASTRQLLTSMGEMANQQKNLLDSFAKQLSDLTRLNESKLERVRETVESKLTLLQQENGQKLEQMRQTVDEKLNQTLEKRLGESFQLVSQRLEQVHKGLGEMQSLAAGVGDLKRVLTNVKTRGTMGEIQLETILEQILSPEQYEKNVSTRPNGSERVEFAIRLPGREGDSEPVLLPIDSKFPLEDYQRLLDAQDAGDLAAVADAAKMLESRIKTEAKTIREKYIHPPYTTDFALMFLPIEGLFAEVLRKSGLWDQLQREFRVVVTGPTTVTALLNSLQMGFRTLAIQKRSSEVWQILGAVKTEFGKFGTVLEKTQKKLEEASNTIQTASVRTRAIERKLRSVEALPAETAESLLDEAALSVLDERIE